MRTHSASSAPLAVVDSGFCTVAGVAVRCVRGSGRASAVSAVEGRRLACDGAVSGTCSLDGKVAAGTGFVASETTGGDGSTGATGGVEGRGIAAMSGDAVADEGIDTGVRGSAVIRGDEVVGGSVAVDEGVGVATTGSGVGGVAGCVAAGA